MFDLKFDLTNMNVIKLNIKMGSLSSERSIVKYLVALQDTTIQQFTYAITALLKLMQGGSIKDLYNSFVLSVNDNRNSSDRRYKQSSDDSTLNHSFRADQPVKPRVFQVVDQMSDEQKIAQAVKLAAESGLALTKDSQKKEYLKQLKYHQMQICSEAPNMADYDFPSQEQVVSQDSTLTAFLMKQQHQSMLTDRPVILDFKAPLEMDLVFLQDHQL